ncbi:MAG: glycosyl transferase family 1, partial [Phycisphaerae bacterium]
VARRYACAFEQACASFPSAVAEFIPERKVFMRMSLPEVNLRHLFTVTDDTGMLQHAVYTTPDRRHGYCTDDNARALIVSAMVWSLFKDERVLPKLFVYLSFLHFAHVPETGRFRNFMSYDRRWLEDDGSDDCQGRSLWALGYLASHAPNDSTKQLAAELFRNAMARVESLEWPRAWALSILGLHYYLRMAPGDAAARQKLGDLAYRLNSRFVERSSADWPWFEDTVTYDNGRIPQALIIAGAALQQQELTDRGIKVLQWLVDVQTAKKGHLSVIGNNGWFKRSGERARFDQQAIEPAALIGACKAAYRASGDRLWLTEMRRCFEWFMGRNDIGQPMIDFKSRGCYDGLKPDGVSQNQGAESLLSWLFSSLIMHEMQTGDALEIG